MRYLPHIVSTSDVYLFIYLFIYLFVYENELLVTWFLVWVFRLEKTGFQYTVSRLCYGRQFLFSADVFLLTLKIFRAVLLVYRVSRSRFPFGLFLLLLFLLLLLLIWKQSLKKDMDIKKMLRRYLFTNIDVVFVHALKITGACGWQKLLVRSGQIL